MPPRHPLENPSLAPYGFVFPVSRIRLEFKPPGYVNLQARLARQWDKWNRQHAARLQPVRTIIHEILPGLATVNHLREGDFVFDGLPYLSRDILMLSAAVQWFGSNVGNAFLEAPMFLWEDEQAPHPEREFMVKLAREMPAARARRESGRYNPVLLFAHECNQHCRSQNPFSFRHGCYYDPKTVTRRDYAVIEGLMRWLGRSEGRAFIAEFIGWQERSRAERTKATLKQLYAA